MGKITAALVLIFSIEAFACESLMTPVEKQFLRTHNRARAAKNIPPLVWDSELASFADKWAKELAKTCKLTHTQDRSYGENLAQNWGSETYKPKRVVNNWLNEEANFDYATNTCKQGSCGHYTQVVWRDTKRLGCSYALCLNPGSYKLSGIYVCEYAPPGNYRGQKPY